MVKRGIREGHGGRVHHQLAAVSGRFVQLLRAHVDGCDLPCVDPPDHAFSPAAQVKDVPRQFSAQRDPHLSLPFLARTISTSGFSFCP